MRHFFAASVIRFQLAAARRRLVQNVRAFGGTQAVSTRSRPKAAGPTPRPSGQKPKVSTRSRPKAAGLPPKRYHAVAAVSTRSRPKAAGAAGWVSQP